MKKLLGILLSTLVVVTSFPLTTQAASVFADVPGDHMYVEEINALKNRSIASGYTDGTYKPFDGITRYEFTKIVIGSKYSDSQIQSCNISGDLFPDVPSDQLFGKWVCIAKRESIVNGYSDGSFYGENKITYGQALKVLMRTLDPATASSLDPKADLQNYIDRFSSKNVYVPNIANDAEISRAEVAYLTITIKDGYKVLYNSKLRDKTNNLDVYFIENENYSITFNSPVTNSTNSEFSGGLNQTLSFIDFRNEPTYEIITYDYTGDNAFQVPMDETFCGAYVLVVRDVLTSEPNPVEIISSDFTLVQENSSNICLLNHKFRDPSTGDVYSMTRKVYDFGPTKQVEIVVITSGDKYIEEYPDKYKINFK